MDKIHHIAVQVINLTESIRWYVKEFDVEVVYQDDTWAMLKFENIQLALVLPDQHPGHFAIESKNASEYGQLKKHRDGTASIYIKDPAGNSIEMLELPKE
jgi:catechol 2,3-dioxygenase-like lactoylglutathione lyase family enzyme